MTEIRVLPTTAFDQHQLHRLRDNLAEMHRAGADLGSRVPHIHAAGDTLQHLNEQLQEVTNGLLTLLNARHSEAVSAKAETMLLQLINEVRGLAELAQSFPGGDL